MYRYFVKKEEFLSQTRIHLVIQPFVITPVFKPKPASLLPNMKPEIHYCETDTVKSIHNNITLNSLNLPKADQKCLFLPR